MRPIVPKYKLLYLFLDVKLKDMKKTMYLFLNHAKQCNPFCIIDSLLELIYKYLETIKYRVVNHII